MLDLQRRPGAHPLARATGTRRRLSAAVLLAVCGLSFGCSERKVLFPADAAVACGAVGAVYENAAELMAYVKNQGGGGAIWNRCAGACSGLPPFTGTPCTGNERGYFACLHGGELRFFEVQGATSCDELTAEDARSAFDWTCDHSAGRVLFFSKGLRPGKGLGDLLVASPTLGFAANSVTVHRQGTPACQTPNAVWWTNTIAPLPAQRATAATLASDTIYVAATSTISNGYAIASADRVAVVTLPGATVGYGDNSAPWCADDGTYAAAGAGTSRPVLCVGGTSTKPSRFLWIEARVDPRNATADVTAEAGILLASGVRMTRIHRSEVVGRPGADGARIVSQSADTSSILIDESWSSEMVVRGSPYVTVLRSRADGGGFVFSSPGGLLYDDTASNSVENGFHLISAPGQVAIGLASFSNTGPGFTLESSGSGATVLMASAAFANRGAGPNMGMRIAGAGDTLANVVVAGTLSNCMNFSGCRDIFARDLLSAHNACGFQQGDSSGGTFGGTLWFGENRSGSCQNQDGTGNLANDEDCQPANGYLAVGGVNLESSFPGEVASDGTNATAGVGGTIAAAGVTDWHHFENRFRAFGLARTTGLFSEDRAGACTSGICQLFDYTLAAGDSMMKARFGAWTNDGRCPASVESGANSAVITDAAGRTFLAHAVELLDTWLNPNGDYDGLCESGEGCLFTPNLGPYQGRGDPATSKPCLVAGGNGVRDVRLWAYPMD